METSKLTHIYFIGIGGIGMSALARYFKSLGKHVSGYDKTATALTHELQAEGIHVHFDDNQSNIPLDITSNIDSSKLLVVYTPAIPESHKGLIYFKSLNFPLKKRAEVLGLITANTFTIAVAGTHGKTTTSSIVAHLLTHAGFNCTAFLGGITKNYNTNYLPGAPSEGSPIVVVEADEYDRSFLTLEPDLSIITSMDADHLDIYGDKHYMEESYRLFAQKLKPGGKLIYKKGLALDDLNLNSYSYSVNEQADIFVQNVRVENHRYQFDWTDRVSNIQNLTSDLPGRHNVENSIAAIAVCRLVGLSEKQIEDGMKSYLGVRRRFDIQVRNEDVVFIDDYAHHPEELKACILSARELYKGKKILGIFQPHLYSRTRDFVDGFAESLSMLDELIMLDIYPARELPIPGITSSIILDKMSLSSKVLCKKEDVIRELEFRKFDVILSLGAGDIDQLVEPIKKFLLSSKTKTVANEK